MAQRELHLSILILEDEPGDAELFTRELKKAGLEIDASRVDSKEDFLAGLEKKPDIILADYQMATFGAVAALRALTELDSSIPLIAITGSLDDERARECMDLGAADYLLKDRLARLGPAVVRAHLERKLRTEKEEALSNYRRMAAVIEATPDFVGIAGGDHRVLYINRAGRAMTGISADEDISAFSLEDFVPDSMKTHVTTDVLNKVLESGTWSGESLFCGPNGVEFPVSQVIIAHREGEEVFFSTVVRDITSRIRAEAELRDSKSRFQAVWDYSKEAMRLTNRDGIIQAVNEPYCQLVGMRAEDLVGSCFTTAYADEEDHEALKSLHRRRFDEGVILFQEESRKRFAHRDREIDVEVNMNRIVVEGGEDLLLTMARDISEKKELEAQFLRSQRMECIGALAGGVAHDFNNILAPIFMATSMLRMDISSSDREKALATIEESGQRGAGVVRRLLLFAKGIEGEKKPLQPGDLFREVAALVERSFPRNIRLQARIHPDLWTVNGDDTQLHQVLLNLCLNARDAMPEGGELVLEARNVELESEDLPDSPYARSGSYVVATIQDTGTGISPDHLDEIFAPFFSTKGPDAGTGLGLSTSLGIIKSHGGFITVESELGEGARFDVYLPVSRPWEPTAAPAPIEKRESDGGGELILVVDDEALVLEVMSKVLQKCGYQTLLATSGEEALSKLPQGGDMLAAIVTDLIMPEMDGLQFLRKVRETHPDLPAIAMSGNVDQSFLEALAEIGVTEVIDKPFRADQLLKVVRSVIG